MAQVVAARSLEIVSDPMQVYERNRRPSFIEKVRDYESALIPLCGLIGVVFASRSWTKILFGSAGVYLGLRTVQWLDRFAEDRRIETAEQRAAFCKAILSNCVYHLPLPPKTPPRIVGFFRRIFRKISRKPELVPPLDVRPIVTKQSYLQNVSDSDVDTQEDCYHVMVECILRSRTKPDRKNLPRIFFTKVAEVQRLQKKFQRLSVSARERFSLLQDQNDCSECSPLIYRGSPLYQRIYYYFFPVQMPLWNEARNLAGYFYSMQGPMIIEMWRAFVEGSQELHREL
jgi:hypothetical protein